MNLSNTFMLLIAGAMLLQGCGNDKKETDRETGVPVRTSQVVASPVPNTYQYSGTVSSLKKSTLSTRIMGQIDKVYVSEGNKVKKGQLLLSIRSNDIMAKKSQVEANIVEVSAGLKNAEADYNRISALYETKSATKKELDDITTHLDMMQARLNAAQKARAEVEEMMTYANIRAPYTGVVTNLFVDAGDMANPGMPLIAVEGPGTFEVITRIPESEIDLIATNDTVYVNVKNVEQLIQGVVSAVSTSSRLSGAQFETKILLMPNARQLKELRSGMFAQVTLSKGDTKKIMVPKALIVHRGQLTGIWTVSESNTALLRWVRLGKSIDQRIEILSGLSVGDRLILNSEVRLHDGMRLELK
ncbi:RND family efflux transporter, MFP subunit [Saccharicrinis carchari]|uniref:RND family efflux transporter, MFP subunit n=1 Tax=Saccharicrinis carchari TaxID=1168039 RepID=A0A521AX53_SACCC|nr:efflux RND transporter periplasmic adaptor subunit [Saccharicrinis carchari]SMO39395.1 RND family efflux transporter, MFP subunit [Saccharicrinis carchari]